MPKFRILLVVALALGAAFPALTAWAASTPEIYLSGKKEFGANYAVGGYDAVAYQTVGTPTRGDPQISFDWKGAKWLFATPENRAAFMAAPETYAPQYGGYCAYGVARGYAVHGDPQQWTVRDGKLYLNYDAGVQKTWVKDQPGYIAKANVNWPKILGAN